MDTALVNGYSTTGVLRVNRHLMPTMTARSNVTEWLKAAGQTLAPESVPGSCSTEGPTQTATLKR